MIVDAERTTQVEKVLLVGADAGLRDQFEKNLPAAQLAEEDTLLAALVRVSREPFDLALIRPEKNRDDLEAALRGLKRVKPDLPVFLAVDMFDEPGALSLTQRGFARDYLILPLRPHDLEIALRKHLPESRANVCAEPTGQMPVLRPPSRVQAAEPAEGLGASESFVREITELIHAAEHGLKELLERACAAAVFLCHAQGARVIAGDQSAQIGPMDRYELVIPLIENGREIGKLELAGAVAQASTHFMAGHLREVLPGLVRLASTRGKLQEMANTDPLTGLANRRHLQEVLENLVTRARQERSRVTLVIFDFDDFKHYNDAYGHGAGDEILRESALLIKRCIRRQDLAARFGGDEFAVILWDWQERRVPNSEHPRSAMVIMERFRKLLKNHFFHRLGPQAQGALTISGGLASFPWDCSDVATLIERADEALLEAKRSGKDRIYLVGQGPEAAKNL